MSETAFIETDKEVLEENIYLKDGCIVWETALNSRYKFRIMFLLRVMRIAEDNIVIEEGEERINWPAVWKELGQLPRSQAYETVDKRWIDGG